MSFIVGYAKLGTSSCKKCKVKIEKTSLRIGKVTSNPFSEGAGDMKQWFHPTCMFASFLKARATTKIVEEPEDLDGFIDLKNEDKSRIAAMIDDCMSKRKNKASPKAKKLPAVSKPVNIANDVKELIPPSTVASTTDTFYRVSPTAPSTSQEASFSTPGEVTSELRKRDNSLRNFRRLCADIAANNSHLEKTKIVSNCLHQGSNGDGFHGDTYLLLKLLLPGVIKSVYNLNSKQLVKHFSQIFQTDLDEMVEDLNNGDVAETVKTFFEKSTKLPPITKSLLSIHEVDILLRELSEMTKDQDQITVLTKISQRCTGNDLKIIVRLIKHDLRINSGAKHILDGLDDNAYAAFQASRDLKYVVDRVLANRSMTGNRSGVVKTLSIEASVMIPVLPMLAEACRSVEYAMKKCPNGFYAEIKYDGERVQLHKNGSDFQYFSRSLKPVLNHKVQHFKDFIPKAFPTGNNLILDSEVLLVDTNTSAPLPFGTLGVHKKAAFKDASVCLFVFDCLHINGENLMNKPIKERRRILSENMTEVQNHVMLSQIHQIDKPDDLRGLMTKVFRKGLEGLVLKDVNSTYQPGKRHWLKVKKDYLYEGSMADSADLVLLGGYYGTGNKGGMMSVFLMGVYNPASKQFCTVTKVSGLDDRTLDNLNRDLNMVKISKDMSRVPSWLQISKAVVPDFVVADPKMSPVWEIAGAEFSQAEIHTADGMSIRFPRVMKARDDKTWETATDLPQLRLLFEKSKDTSDFPDMSKSGKVGKQEVRMEVGADVGDWDHSHIDALPAEAEIIQSVTPVKRKLDNNVTAGSKKIKSECKYGANCYQTNVDHHEQFCHPSHHTFPSPNKVLPNVFEGMKIYMPAETGNYMQLRRYIIAFGGDILLEHEKDSATHLVQNFDKQKIPHPQEVVTTSWLWSCIKKKCRLPFTWTWKHIAPS